MSETLGLKNINMLSKEMYSGLSDVATDELYAISGSGFGFPSNRYEDLELGATGTTYTAPGNGWLCLAKKTGATNQYVSISNTTRHFQQTVHVASSGSTARVNCQAQRGDIMYVEYSTTGETNAFRFIYAEGE